MNLPNNESAPILSLIQDIKDGRRDPKTLDKELRQQCVEVLLGEGYSKSQMAKILDRSEKTIKRDIDEIQLNNSLVPSEELLRKTVGELRMYKAIHRDHLMRLARVKGSSVSEKAQAEYMAFKILTEYIGKLQNLGYLPTQPQAIVGNMSVTVDDGSKKSYQELTMDLDAIEKTYKSIKDIPADVQQQINSIKEEITKASIQHSIKQLENKSREEEDDFFDI